jgi:hypothetical protein
MMSVDREIKAGDYVKVVRRVDRQEGYKNVWTDPMDAIVGNGKRYKVHAVIKEGVWLDTDVGYHGYPQSSLELCNNESKKQDPGAHYRHSITVKVTGSNAKQGFVRVQLDPAQIAEAYPGMSGMRFTILKKVLRCGSGGKSYEQDLLDIISAAKRELELIGC